MKETELFICACNSFEHQVKFYYLIEEKQLYATIHLVTYNSFFKRLITAFKYLFKIGSPSIYGEWDSFIFKYEDQNKLFEFLTNLDKSSISKLKMRLEEIIHQAEDEKDRMTTCLPSEELEKNIKELTNNIIQLRKFQNSLKDDE